MTLKKSFLILCCLSAAACATDAPPSEPAQSPAGAATNASAPTGTENPPPADKTENVVVPDNAKVTITKQQNLTIEEYRVGGRLYMIKITPKHGKPYYLIDDRGDGRFARRGASDFMISPPMWVIKKF